MQRIEAPFELKAADDKGYFEGYGAVFGNKDLDGDIILEGAFEEIRKTKDGKVRVALNHDLRTFAGKADVEQDEKGLFVKGQLDMKLSYVPDAYRLMKNGILDAMSVGFNILPGGSEWKRDEEDDDIVRVISKAQLWEVSIVPFGSNPKASVESVKDAGAVVESARDLERILRKTGFSRKEARAIASGGFHALRCDAVSGVTSETLAEMKEAIAQFKIN